MNSEPRLSYLPFIIADAVCLLTAALIGLYAKTPLAPLPFIASVSLVVLGCIAFMIPVLANHVVASREATARVRDELEVQIKRVQAASESLGRAAAQIKAIEEAVQKSARDAETLPYRMQEKLAEFNQALAEKENDEREALEREVEELRAASSDQLRAVAEKISKATTDWAALETATRRQLTHAQEAGARLDELLKRSLAQLEARTANAAGEPAAAPAPVDPDSKPAVAGEIAAAPASETPAVAAMASHDAGATNGSEPLSVEIPKIKKPRAPRKPKPEEVLAAMSETPPAMEIDVAPVAATPDEVPAPAPAEPASSSDGATRLLATAYIGIGNKLFIRGDGPGLSWEKGIPMQFVSIGKWGWSTHDAASPVSVKLYKNDEAVALSGGLTIEPGRHTEVTALF